ncbi:MAG TPA: hypothetical protein VHA73_05565 [Acidimicrobiales bacterium]|jgi:hypothetical protein|nr:hypothetical protein [Acidimicrobiales bacterium]
MADAAGFYDAEGVAETLAIERRLRDRGFADVIDVLKLGGHFDFDARDVAGIVREANRYLLHQETVDLAGARILSALGEVAVKAQAFDAIAAIVRRTARARTP